MKLFTIKFLLIFLTICISFSNLSAFNIFSKSLPYPEKDLNDLANTIEELLKKSPTESKLKKLQMTIHHAQLLIDKNPEEDNRSEEEQKSIDKALKDVRKQYDNL